MDVQFLFGCLILATVCHLGCPCSCSSYKNVKNKYCDSDFVLKVWVTSTLQNPEGMQSYDDFYEVRILGTPWKFDNKKAVKDLTRVYTGSNGALCGLRLQKGKRYLISGVVFQNKMRIGLCGSIVQRTRLPRNVKKLRKNPPFCSTGPKRTRQ